MTQQTPARTPGWLPPLVADLACVLVFAIGGRASHEAGSPALVVLAIMWPFALSVAVAHAGLILRRRRTVRAWPEGVVVLGVTFVLGMVLRIVSGRGVALSFLVVALSFLALTMLGWRTLLRLAARRRSSQQT